MTPKEAIDNLKYMISGDCTDTQVDFVDEIDMAIEALEKQIPKKPTKLTHKILIDAGWIYACPNCEAACGENKYHPEVTDDEMYCPSCGQAIDWSE